MTASVNITSENDIPREIIRQPEIMFAVSFIPDCERQRESSFQTHPSGDWKVKRGTRNWSRSGISPDVTIEDDWRGIQSAFNEILVQRMNNRPCKRAGRPSRSRGDKDISRRFFAPDTSLARITNRVYDRAQYASDATERRPRDDQQIGIVARLVPSHDRKLPRFTTVGRAVSEFAFRFTSPVI